MTVRKESLLEMGVLKEDIPDNEEEGRRAAILQSTNIVDDKLQEFAVRAANFATEARSSRLPHNDWAMLGSDGVPDCSISTSPPCTRPSLRDG